MTRISYQDYERLGILCNDWLQPGMLHYELNDFKSLQYTAKKRSSQVSDKINVTWHWSEHMGISHIPQLCISARPDPFGTSNTFRHSTQTRFSPTLCQVKNGLHIYLKNIHFGQGQKSMLLLLYFKSNRGDL